MASIIGLIKRCHSAFISPPSTTGVGAQAEPPLRFGILGAAAIAPPALITPAKSHLDVTIYAVAARDIQRAEQFAKKYGITKFYGGKTGYQELLDDPQVDVIYNPLPNGLHYEWTMKALAAGKHVLLEKPSGDTAEETRRMFDFAERKGLVLLEAFHYRFHPAVQRLKAILDSGELGAIKEISASLAFPKGFIGDDNIRMNFDIGGGAMMDCGCYPLSCLRYLTSSNPTEVLSASATRYPKDSRIDTATTASLLFPSAAPDSEPIKATLRCDFSVPPRFGFIPRWPDITARVTCERGTVELFNFVMPVIYHSITVRPEGGRVRTEKAYTFPDGSGKKGEEWWTTYRHQLEAFVDKLRGREPQTWVDREDSTSNMVWIEKIYEVTGLGSRPQSEFQIPESE
ncbi:NAD(P)-binding protein [Leucogyrophana mollusca]|uniref:NAD(P)-binding protein n=1 Tax=Leucogyrophana mollusca TaxID=85980 RepID=A0ACB8BQV2_9AGAM|nr:NAD(P)-binding protein [Leucogyrophana mollusca]